MLLLADAQRGTAIFELVLVSSVRPARTGSLVAHLFLLNARS
jgi:hypothetical protein